MLFQETGIIIIFLRMKSFVLPDSTVLHLKRYVFRFIIQNDFRVQGGAMVHIMGWYHTKSPHIRNYAKATTISHLFQQFSILTNIYSLHWTDTDNLSTTVSKQNKWPTAERKKNPGSAFTAWILLHKREKLQSINLGLLHSWCSEFLFYVLKSHKMI